MTLAVLAAPAACLIAGLGLIGSALGPLARRLTEFSDEHGRDATEAEMDRLLGPIFTDARRTRSLFGLALVVASLLWACLIPAVAR